MNLLPAPEVTIDNADVEVALRRAVRIINPLLDVLWGTDPLGLKRRGAGDGPLDSLTDRIAWVLNAADVPGTQAWDDLDANARINWWVWRVGALNTVVVAFPGVLGVLARRLPIQDLLGFVSQALVLVAVARELGVTEQKHQVRMLAAVLCHRDLSAADPGAGIDAPEDEVSFSLPGIGKALWRLVGLFDAIGDELDKRPHPRAPYRYLGMLPVIGAVAAYFGEWGALSRAAKAGRRWVKKHPSPTGLPNDESRSDRPSPPRPIEPTLQT